MNMCEMKTYFRNQFDYIKEAICRVVFFAEYDDHKLCKIVADALIGMTKTGENDIAATAAAMYYLITVRDDHGGIFSLETAKRLLFEHDAIKQYFDLLEDIFSDILESYYYDELYSLPAIHLLEMMAKQTYLSENDG